MATFERRGSALVSPDVFVEKKRCDAIFRDAACKAICTIKRGLREKGAQQDGKPFIPDNWDARFKPVLGPYLKFLLSRPDQFRVVEGAQRGEYTVEHITMNRTVVAPSLEQLKGSKGKLKGKGKGKGVKGSKGKVKGKGKNKDAGFKGSHWEHVKEDDSHDTAAHPEVEETPKRRAMGLSRVSQQRTVAELEEEAEAEGLEDDAEKEATLAEAVGVTPAAADDVEWDVDEDLQHHQEGSVVDEDMEVDCDDLEYGLDEAVKQEATCDIIDKATDPEDPAWSLAVQGHGSYIKSLLSGKFFSAPKCAWVA